MRDLPIFWEVFPWVAKRRISGVGRVWQALHEVLERAASGSRLEAQRSKPPSLVYIYIYIYYMMLS